MKRILSTIAAAVLAAALIIQMSGCSVTVRIYGKSIDALSDIDLGYGRVYLSQVMNALTTASVESYLNSSSYSSVDRFSDYIFDQNDYTTSDGYNVKISTGYDYVWDGGNGTVYYSSSSFCGMLA